MKNLLKKIISKILKIIEGNPKFEDYNISFINPIKPLKSNNKKPRINIVITSLNKKNIYGGIKTALDFFLGFSQFLKFDRRIIILNSPIDKKDIYIPDGFYIASKSNDENNVIVDLFNRSTDLYIRENDIFITTFWNTTYCMLQLSDWFLSNYNKKISIIYFIQDYEPGFYPWSSNFLLAESTYRNPEINVVFNSSSLSNYFKNMGYEFKSSYFFEPKINSVLKKYINKRLPFERRKNQILIYGRPFNSRNCFEIILMGLNKWYETDSNAKNYEIISAGYDFPEIKFKSGLKIKNLGKLSLEEYAKILCETKFGVSLMASPHPSYPPLEMAAFGIKVITNSFFNKDLNDFSSNIISLKICNVETLAQALSKITKNSTPSALNIPNQYTESNKEIFELIYLNLKKNLNL